MPGTNIQNIKLTLRDVIYIITLLGTIGTFTWNMAAKEAKMDARMTAVEEKSSINTQELEDNNLELVNYKLDKMGESINKIMDKLGIIE